MKIILSDLTEINVNKITPYVGGLKIDTVATQVSEIEQCSFEPPPLSFGF